LIFDSFYIIWACVVIVTRCSSVGGAVENCCHWFVRSFIHLLIHSFIHLFIYSFVQIFSCFYSCCISKGRATICWCSLCCCICMSLLNNCLLCAITV